VDGHWRRQDRSGAPGVFRAQADPEGGARGSAGDRATGNCSPSSVLRCLGCSVRFWRRV